MNSLALALALLVPILPFPMHDLSLSRILLALSSPGLNLLESLQAQLTPPDNSEPTQSCGGRGEGLPVSGSLPALPVPHRKLTFQRRNF